MKKAADKPAKASKPGGLATKTLVLTGLTIFTGLVLAPFLVVLINAFKSSEDYSQGGPLALPTEFYLQGMIDFWNRVEFGEKLWNSFVIAAAVSVLAVIISVLNAYAIGIGRLRGRTAFLMFFLLANLLPQEALVYPLYYLSKQFDLYNTRLMVIIILTAIQAAFGTYLLSSVFRDFPPSLLEAAALDGAGKLRTLLRVVVPTSWPTLSVLFTFFFIWTWNEFFLPLIFLIDNDLQTVPLALAVLQGQREVDITTTAASALLGIVPAVLFFLIFQRTLTRGVMSGAVK
ncbi:raffinose/stachyose/melibiose transport system permease protein [Catenuloplanes nepalensis]|uniref:Raffinose/stachyose/melibiose transport system permease protein n=1 Tax=Catenuloplanes nepalensis TaxID=587533 RepID=A0ABT9MYZ6_9ACTN|nr:carbohydrate ABC transporter permease [Catenuloplanes nepalensis]MDP9796660.1 raffinose/stachyose/melibiose transport system permease protein [Catenuloplanes nepalensis]